MEKKRCVICNKQKPLDQFSKNDTIAACVRCKQLAIADAKRNR